MAEAEIRDLLAKRLVEAGDNVYTEVTVDMSDRDIEGTNGTGRIDVLSIPPIAWIKEHGYECLGFEVKVASDFQTFLVDACLQAAKYKRAKNPRKNKLSLPSPSVVLVASTELMSKDGWRLSEGVANRFAWRMDVAYLTRRAGWITFKSNDHGDNPFHPLFPIAKVRE